MGRLDIQKIDAPLVRLGVIETERLSFDTKVLFSIPDVKFFEVSIAVQDLLMIRNAVIFDPGIRTVETVGKPANVSLPIADEKVEIVRSIALRGGQRGLGSLGIL